MNRLINIVKITLIIAVFCVPYLPSAIKPAQAATNSLMIVDSNFDNSASMSTSDIQTFLNKYPNSCLKSYSDEYPNDYFSYGAPVTAATVIRRVADLWGINPQVILTKLEQEENLVTGSMGCNLYQYASAVGFSCPGPTLPATFKGQTINTCVIKKDSNNNYVVNYDAMGFSRQITKGGWLLKWAKERANGNLSWLVPDDAAYYYGGPMTQGTRQRSSSSPAVYYDGYWNGVYISSGATASLYNYTPFFNQGFSAIYQNFFGYDPSVVQNPVLSCQNGTNLSGIPNGLDIIPNKVSNGYDLISKSILNQTDSKCIELHKWTQNFQSWVSHTATNRVVINSNNSKIISADLNGDGTDEMVLVEFEGTGSGKVELHVWSPSNQTWVAHIATVQPAMSKISNDVVSADTNGDGKDEILLINYNGTATNKIEIHGLSSNMQGYFLHVATARQAVDKNSANLLAADQDGDGKDEIYLLEYNNTASGKIELHGFANNYQAYFSHVATNHPVIDSASGKVIAANITGSKADEFILVRFPSSSSTGLFEFHGWLPGQQSWFLHSVAAN